MPHPFAAERVHHTAGIADGDIAPRQSIVCKRSRHQALPAFEMSLQGVFFNEETEIRPAAFDGNASTITRVKKLKFQNRTEAAFLYILNSEFIHGLALRETAQ